MTSEQPLLCWLCSIYRLSSQLSHILLSFTLNVFDLVVCQQWYVTLFSYHIKLCIIHVLSLFHWTRYFQHSAHIHENIQEILNLWRVNEWKRKNQDVVCWEMSGPWWIMIDWELETVTWRQAIKKCAGMAVKCDQTKKKSKYLSYKWSTFFSGEKFSFEYWLFLDIVDMFCYGSVIKTEKIRCILRNLVSIHLLFKKKTNQQT